MDNGLRQATNSSAPAEESLALCPIVAAGYYEYPAPDMQEVMHRMHQICSGQSEKRQEQLASLLGRILQHSSIVHIISLKACVMIIAEMLALLQESSPVGLV